MSVRATSERARGGGGYRKFVSRPARFQTEARKFYLSLRRTPLALSALHGQSTDTPRESDEQHVEGRAEGRELVSFVSRALFLSAILATLARVPLPLLFLFPHFYLFSLFFLFTCLSGSRLLRPFNFYFIFICIFVCRHGAHSLNFVDSLFSPRFAEAFAQRRWSNAELTGGARWKG